MANDIQGYSEEELAGLTEEELAGIRELQADERENDEYHEKLDEEDEGGIVNDKPKKPEATDPPSEDDPTDPPADVDPPKDAPKDVEPPKDEPKAEQQDAPKPLFDAQPVENYAQQIKDIKDQKAAAASKLEEGDFTYAEYHAEIEKLNDAEMDLKLAQRDYEIAQKTQKQQSKNAWDDACADFLSANAEYDSQGRFKVLNDYIMQVANDPKSASYTAEQILTEAHRLTEEDIGPAPNKRAKADPAPNGKKAAVLPDTPTLNRIPAAETNEASENRFAYLDKLTGEDFEAAFDRLSPADQDAYMK